MNLHNEKNAKTLLVLAIFKMPFMHKLTKSMAENTYVKSKGKNILKTKIDSNPSKTPKQQRQRLKMKTLVKLCKLFNAATQVGFPERPIDFSGWNAFNSANQAAVVVSEELEVSINYEAIQVAQGSLEVAEEVRVVKDEDSHGLTVSHMAESFAYGMNKDDVLYAVVLETEKNRTRVYRLNEREDEMPATVTLPASWSLDSLMVYVFMLSADGRKASGSVCVEVE